MPLIERCVNTMDIRPIISVVVPVYNVEKYLEKCVKSICQQTFKEIEIVLVDDGSKDNSGKLCDELAKVDDRIKVVHKNNGGLSDARNVGIKVAAGDFIGLVDSDDYVASDMYEILYRNLIREHADVAVCTAYSCYEDKVLPYQKAGYETMSGIEFLGRTLSGDCVIVSACCKLYKKKLLLDTQFQKGRLYEDAFILGELFSKVDKVVVEYSPKYYYVHHAGTITTNSYTAKNKDYIKAYEINKKIVQNLCPKYMEAAQYRLFRAYYELADLALLSETAEAQKDLRQFKKFLKDNFWSIWGNKYVVNTRKIAVFLILLNQKIYRRILIEKNKKVQLSD